MKKPKKLTAGPATDSLLSKLLRVPKSEADKAARDWKKARKKKKK